MSTLLRTRLTWLSLFAGLGCGDAGGHALQIDLFVQGSTSRNISISGGAIELTSAQLALGPLYLCASLNAEQELCESAAAEWRGSTTVDVLSDDRTRLGSMNAISSSVHSAALDYGISWLLTQNSAQPTSDIAHSALLEGSASGDDGNTLTFEAAIDVLPVARGSSALQLRSDAHTLRADDTLTLRIDPALWLAHVRYTDLEQLDDDQDGHVVLAAGTQPYEAIVQAMSASSGLPVFDWQ